MKGQSFLQRLGFALSGLAVAWQRERSFRTQTLAAIAVLCLLLIVRPAPVWWAVAAMASAGVIVAELFNATIEHLCDHLHPERHPAIKAAKDLAAAAVLIASLGALAVGVLLLLATVFD